MGTTTDIVIDQRLRDIQQEYLEFLDDEVSIFDFYKLLKINVNCSNLIWPT